MYSKGKAKGKAQTYFFQNQNLNDSALQVNTRATDTQEAKLYESLVELKINDKINFAAQSSPEGISGYWEYSFYIISIDLDTQLLKDEEISAQVQHLLHVSQSESCWYKKKNDKIYSLSFNTQESAQRLLDLLQPLLSAKPGKTLSP